MRALYTAATGMNARQIQLENIANNLANSTTTGYKKTRETFADLIYQQVGGSPAGDPMQLGSGTRVASLSRDFRSGNVIVTSNPTDLMIDGEGFFAVETPNGETMYTRDGHFRIDLEGNLTTQDGYIVQPGFQIPEGGTLMIGSDGSVSALLQTENGSESVSLGQFEMARFPNPEALMAAGRNYFRATTAAGEAELVQPQTGGAGTVIQYALEGANVDVAEELINMISAQRSYELSSKVIQTADEMMQIAASLKR